ncbi:carbohydrate kinase family protein [Micromonospora yangpuensis]|uniref:Sugar or nucleoside kinase, ribokinase family n=1 Tax=Micromonospora yangpuensis TaxID=683228 RepID=A0A1C6UDJ2_9ACTN|nr:PfkB family carbohydrate kinase [Micromonospora yangpuensis]GGM26908.1 ribokinase [Micromonospora yangpuensis]SCL52028.1 Sugar or nucleoside kinase, ribokinase family [Micromonospora yangpuensis]
MTGPGRVLVVGDVVTDVVAMLAGPVAPGSDTPAAIRMTGGGQAANTAAWLAAQGVPVTLVAAVGADDAGRDRTGELTRGGVVCAVESHRDAATGTVIVLAGADERTMVTERGANLLLSPGHVERAVAAAPDARHLHLSGYPLLDAASRPAGLRALAVARERGLTTSVDAASAAPLRQVGAEAFLTWVRDVDLLLVNADEATALAGGTEPAAQARTLSGWVRRVVVKRGAAGALWADRDVTVDGPAAPQVPVVDVTGAGDAFAAGLLAAWLTGEPVPAALERAGALGAAAVGTPGARPPG